MDGRQSFVQNLRANPGVLDLTLSSAAPFDIGQSTNSVRLPGKQDLYVPT